MNNKSVCTASNACLLTIYIPTYNRASSLSILLNSLCPQVSRSNGLVELIISDNDSTDSTAEVVRSYQAMCQIRYIRNDENIGPARNVLRGFNLHAQGQYCWTLGDDELIREDAVQKILDALNTYAPDFAFVNCSTREDSERALVGDAISAEFFPLLPAKSPDLTTHQLASWQELLNPQIDSVYLGSLMCGLVRVNLIRGRVNEEEVGSEPYGSLAATYPHAFAYSRLLPETKSILYIGYPCTVTFWGDRDWNRHLPLIVVLRLSELIDAYELAGASAERIRVLRAFQVTQASGFIATWLDEGNPDRKYCQLEYFENKYKEWPGFVNQIKGALGLSTTVSETIKFSVLMPTYNQAAFLPAAIESLLAQSYSNWEVVVVNDGSTDETPSVLAQYAARDQRIRVYHKSNGGAASALNEALRHVSGDWVLWLSSDDLFEPTKMAVHAEAIKTFPETRFFYTHHYLLQQESGQKYLAPFDVAATIPSEELQVLALMQLNYINGITVAIHRSVFDVVGTFDETLKAGLDFDLWLRISARFKSHFLNHPLSVTRLHPGQDTAKSVMRGIYDSGVSCIRFLSSHTFSEVFPLLDLSDDDSAARAIEATVLLLLNPQAYLNLVGAGTLLVDRLVEWIGTVSVDRRERFAAVLQDFASHVDTLNLPPDIKAIFHYFNSVPLNAPLVFQPENEYSMLVSRLEFLRGQGGGDLLPTLQDYLEHQYQPVASVQHALMPASHVLLVAHNFPPRAFGGVELYVYHMARALQQQGIRVSVIYPVIVAAPGNTDIQIARMEYDGIVVYQMLVNTSGYMLEHQLFFPEMTAAFGHFLQRESVDVVHFHHLMGWPAELVRTAKQQVSRVIVTLHDFWPLCFRIHLYVKEDKTSCSGPEDGAKCARCVRGMLGFAEENIPAFADFFASRTAAMRAAVAEADDITAPSVFMQKTYASWGYPADRMLVAPLGVNLVEPVKQALHSPVSFGYMGTIHQLKNVYLLVDVFKQLQGQARLVIYGGGAEPDIAVLRAQIAGYENIFYGGAYRPAQLPQILAAMDVLVVPSAVESYCFTAREALSAGIPVIAARVGGLADAVQEGGNGWLVEPTASELQSKMQEIVDRPALLQQLGTLADRNFPSVDEDAAQWAAHYRSFVQRTPVMVSPMVVSVIICSINEKKFAAVAKNYGELLAGVRHEIIHIADAKSLCEGYNRGIDQASGEVLIFSHDDIKILNPDFWPRLQRHLGVCDLVGVAGTTLLAGPIWGHAGVPFVHGTVIHRMADEKFMINPFDVGVNNLLVQKAQAFDGLFFAVNRRVLSQVRFDADMFDGFHFYDLDFTYRAYLAGFNLGVCRDIAIIHESQGGYDSVWEHYACLFLGKHRGSLRPRRSPSFHLPTIMVDSEAEALALFKAMTGETDPAPLLADFCKAERLPYPQSYWRYQAWFDKTAISEVDAEIYAQRMVRDWHTRPVIQLLIWLLPGEEGLLADTLDSLATQLYGEWRLTIVSPLPPPDPMWQELPQLHWLSCDVVEWGAALAAGIHASTADWFMFLPPGTVLEPHALLALADSVNVHPAWQLVYADHDRITPDGTYFEPEFKPDFNPDLLRSMPYMGDAVAVCRDILKQTEGYGSYPGWENYYVALSASFLLPPEQIGHIARVLLHFPLQRPAWIQEPVVGLHVLHDALARNQVPASVEAGLGKKTFRINYAYPGTPLVSILIPTRDKLELLRPCVESVLERTAYSNYEVLIADNQSEEPETLNWFAGIAERSNGRVRVLAYDAEFNYSAITNFLVEQASGEYILLLNNDTLVVQDGWLDRLVTVAKRPEVGVVGCRLIYPENGKIQHAGIVLGFNDVAGHVFEGVGGIKYSGYMQRAVCEQNYSAVTAACMLVRRSVYETVGGMDEVELPVLYNDVDLCLKVGQSGYRVVYTPYVTMMHYAGQSLNDVRNLKDAQKVGASLERKARERKVFWQRWRKQIAHDPAWNINLSVRGAEGGVEAALAPGWDVALHARQRVLGVPLTGGAGEYRVISPLRGLRTAGLMQVAWATSDLMFQTRIITEYELARLAPDTILMQAPLDDEQLASLRVFQDYVPEIMRVATFDDLLTHVPEKNSFKRFGFRDVERRMREVLQRVDRCIVTTEPLREWCQAFGAHDVRVLPNCLELAKWGAAESRRGVGSKPRVGWAGAQQHQGDLDLIRDVVHALADEVEWIFLGMCPDDIKPYVHEFHEFERDFDRYPAKLASLNLDLALAPLELHPFNEAKSNLRLLEYGILGWPVICTDIYPYQTNNPPVCRLPNNANLWIDAIRQRIGNLPATYREGDALRQWVLEHYVLENNLHAWQAALTR